MDTVNSTLHKLSCKLIGEASQYVRWQAAKLADELFGIEPDDEEANRTRRESMTLAVQTHMKKQRAIWIDATRKFDDALARISAFLAESVSRALVNACVAHGKRTHATIFTIDYRRSYYIYIHS